MESGESDIYIGVAFILVSLVGAVGSLITLVILKKDDNFRAMNNARLPIGNLAFVDLFLSVINIMYAIGIIDKKTTAHPIVCKITAHLSTLIIPMMQTSYALVALHRWKTLKSYKGYNGDGLVFLARWQSVAATWIICLMLFSISNIPQVMGPIRYQPAHGVCLPTGLLIYIRNAFIIMVCIIITFTSYIKIYRFVKSQNRQIRDHIETTDLNERVLKKRDLKLTKMLFIIFSTLLFCTIPFTIIANLRERLHISVLWQRIALLVVQTNHANNFFIYGLMDQEFRTQVKSLFRCK